MERWKDVKLDEEEETIVDTGSLSNSNEQNRFDLCLVGSVWSEGPYNVSVFQSTLKQIWRLRQGVNIKEIGRNLEPVWYKLGYLKKMEWEWK